MAKKKPSLKYEEVLENAIGFNEYSIEANARGELSEGQRAFIRRRMSYNFLMLFIAVLLSLVGMLMFNSPGAILPIVMGGGLVVYAIVRMAINATELRGNRVESIEGSIGLDIGSTGNSNSYRVRVGNIRFGLNKAQFLAFKNGDPYRLYYLPTSKRLLSAEWLVVDRDVDHHLTDEDGTIDPALTDQGEKRLRR